MHRFLLISLAFLVSCGGGGGDEEAPPVISTNPIVLELADCTALGVREASDTAAAVFDLIDAIDDPTMPPSGVTFDPATGAFLLDVDFDRDGTVDTAIGGQLRAPFGQLGDGFQQGESFTFDWTAMGLYAGGGSMTITHQGASIRFQGVFTVVEPAGCAFAVSELNVSLFPDPSGETEANGIIRFDSQTSNGGMNGVIGFSEGQDAWVDATSEGERVGFFIDLETFQVYIE